jgi:carnosine N-methyltransferase
LWHFENTEGVSSIELTLEDVKLAATKLGFKISSEAEIQTSYTSNPHSMLSSHYTASFFVCTKV